MTMNPDSVDDLLAALVARGLQLVNLFQLADGQWQANVGNRDSVWEFARGHTAAIALRAAMFVAATESGAPWPPEVAQSWGLEPAERKRPTGRANKTAEEMGL